MSQIDEAASAAYTMSGSVTLQGVLNVSALRQALDHVVVRHHVLRTTIEVQEGVAVQRVGAETQGMPLFVVDVDNHDAAEQVVFAPHFDLSSGPLIQGQLIHVDTNVHVLRLAMHHIISDGWSIGLLIQEISQLYTAFLQHQPDPLPPLAIQYGDYAAWQQAHLQGERLQAQQQYWIEQLQGAPDCLTLPTDRPRPGTQQFAGAETTLVLDDVLTAELRALSQQHGCTLFMTLLAGWSALMGRLANQDEVVIGTPSAGRTHTEVEALIGMFVNTQAIRVDLSAHPTTVHLLAQVKETALAALAHQDIPFEQVVEVLAPTRSLAHSPVFQVMFAFQNLPENALELPGLLLSPIKAKVTTVQFDLNLFVYEVDGKLVASLHYATALFDQVTAQRYSRLLAATAASDGDGT
ncbi:condensation domain-containing protein [Vibrio sp. PP-XX7]